LNECSSDFRAGLISVRVNDSPARMRGLFSKLEFSARLEIEISPRSVKLAYARRTFLYEHFDRLRVAKRRTRREGILSMKLCRIPCAKSGGDAALRVCGSAVEQRPLGQHSDVAVRRSPPCSMKPCNTTPHYQKAGSETLGHDLKSRGTGSVLKGEHRLAAGRSVGEYLRRCGNFFS
jgi:hypothetical protein